MKKRMSAGLILAVALTLAAVSALAVYALTRSPEAEAKYQARQAVMDAYGLTAETMGLFHAEHEETDDGWRVTFRALANIDPGRAGVYTVEKTADGRTAAWSHDGLDPALWRGEDLTAPRLRAGAAALRPERGAGGGRWRWPGKVRLPAPCRRRPHPRR